MKLKATTPFGWIVRGCVGLTLFGCIGLFMLGAIGNALGVSATSAAVATREALPTAESLVVSVTTEVPEPTDVPEPTTAPTDKPAPTAATLDNGLTPSENLVITAMGQQIGKIGTALQTISTLAPKYDGSDEWKIDMIVPIVEIQTAHTTLLGMDVPTKLKPFHVGVVRATTDCNDAMTKLISGIDGNNTADIGEAGTLMGSCGTKLTEAQPELDALIAAGNN